MSVYAAKIPGLAAGNRLTGKIILKEDALRCALPIIPLELGFYGCAFAPWVTPRGSPLTTRIKAVEL